jgi:transcriptional regulator GlxA family with amidase domain
MRSAAPSPSSFGACVAEGAASRAPLPVTAHQKPLSSGAGRFIVCESSSARPTCVAVFLTVRCGSPGHTAAVSALSGLLALPRVQESRARGDDRVAAAQAYLLRHWDRPVPVGEVARAVGVSPRWLARAFTARTGLSPYAYHLQVRVQRAKELLGRGWGLAKVAAATGFFDQSHFARHFARLQALSPGRWVGAGGNVQDTR